MISLLLAAALLPNPALTPGARFPTVRPAVLCKSGYTATVRNVTTARKRAVCLSYGVKKGCPGPGYEIDHLIPLELGGSNDDKNLWPEPIADAHRKDVLENALHRDVCAGHVTQQDAQAQMQSWGRP